MWLAVVLERSLPTKVKTVTPNRSSRSRFIPVCTWLYSTTINSPGQGLLPERWVLHAWALWEASKQSSKQRAGHLVISQVFSSHSDTLLLSIHTVSCTWTQITHYARCHVYRFCSESTVLIY